MFTGLIEEAGKVQSITRSESGIRLVVASKVCGKDARIGDSISVSGCCLTVVRRRQYSNSHRLEFDLLEETWRKTAFASLKEGGKVNLERSLSTGARLGGHFVTGHVDGRGKVTKWEAVGADWHLRVRPPAEFMKYLVPKGSVAIDGISLTVAKVNKASFDLWIIPHTYGLTSLHERCEGDWVNLEMDLLGKYVERMMAVRR